VGVGVPTGFRRSRPKLSIIHDKFLAKPKQFSLAPINISCRRYSTSSIVKNDNKTEFKKKYYRLDESDLNNPLIIINSFFKLNASLKKDFRAPLGGWKVALLASEVKQNIDLTIINAILRGLGKYELSSDEFKDLKNIKPVSFNLPLDNCVAKH
jgi:hypothetical protein